VIDRHTSTWSSWFLATGLSLGVHALAFASVLVFEPESRAKPGTTTIDIVNVSFGADLKAVDAATSLAPSNRAEAVKAIAADETVEPTASDVAEQVRPDASKPKRQEAQRLEKAEAALQAAVQNPDKAAQVSEAEKANRAEAAETANRAPPTETANQAQATETANRAPPAETVASSATAKRVAAAPAPDALRETVQAPKRVQATDAGTTPPSVAALDKPAATRPAPSAPRPAATQAKSAAVEQRVQSITVARAEPRQRPTSARAKTVLPDSTDAPSPSRVQTVAPKSVQSALPTASEPPRTAEKPVATAAKSVTDRVTPRVSDQPALQTSVKNAVSAVRPQSSQPAARTRVNNAISAVRPQSSQQSAAPNRVPSSGSAARVSGAKPVAVARLSVSADRTKPRPASSNPVALSNSPSAVAAPTRVKSPSVAAKPTSAVPVTAAPAASAVRPKAVTQKATTKVAAIGPVEPSSEPSAQASSGAGPRTVPLESLQSFDSGDCMLILPRTAGSMRTAFSAFGMRPYAAELFQREMERRHAVDLSISMSPLADAQCAVTEFVRSLPSYPLFSMRIELDRDVIRSGETLQGYLRDATGQLSLILIDDEGFAHSVNQFLSVDGFDVVLSAPMHLTGQPVRTAQMFLAIASPQALNTLADRRSRPAAGFFKTLSAELEAKNIAIDVAVSAFRVE